MAARRELGDKLRRFGLTLPGAFEDHPWGELVLKVKKKVFVFLGKPGEELGFSVKLPRSGERLLDQDWAEPTAYGLGKSGWVTLTVDGANPLGEAELCALIEESYRAVAPKTLVKELDGASPSASSSRSPRARARARARARDRARGRGDGRRRTGQGQGQGHGHGHGKKKSGGGRR